MKPRILHLSADYPDGLDPTKTSAIRGLVEGTHDRFEHRIVSLNRRGGLAGWLGGGTVLDRLTADGVLAYRYGAPPALIAVSWVMQRLAGKIAADLRQTGFRPDLVQGHKLTVEGFLARHLAAQLGVPFVLTLQGNTDQKLLGRRPDRLPALRRIWREARGIMALAPWTAEWCTARLGQPAQTPVIIPCLIPHDAVLPPRATPPLVRTAFNLDFWRNKNIVTLLAAVSRLSAQGRDLRLEIAGSGSDCARAAIAKLIVQAGLAERAVLVGPIAPAQIQDWFNGAALFALPSHRESFGMVFAEALLAGTPVIFPRGAAIDGYFPAVPYARAVAANDTAEVAAAITDLLAQGAAAKAALAEAQADGTLSQFQREAVLDRYARFLDEALA